MSPQHICRWSCLCVAWCAGCAAVREFPAPITSPAVRLVDLAATTESQHIADSEHVLAGGVVGTRTSHILVLSGGGMNGAFTAGVLRGWSESGTRPEYDVVTGVSTGALIAPFAFLGSERDGDLERLYSSDGGGKFYRRRPLIALPWSNALADSEPLRRRIENEVTEGMLVQIAKEHRKGRRLYVGTTNLDSQQLVVWDLGAIAAGTDRNKLLLFRNLLLASCSVPCLLPPVPINIDVDGKPFTEMHADGGVSASLFLLPQTFGMDTSNDTQRDAGITSVHVVVAGKLIPDRLPVDGGILRISDASLHGLMRAQMESDLKRVYLLTRKARAEFRLAAIPQDVGSAPANRRPPVRLATRRWVPTNRTCNRVVIARLEAPLAQCPISSFDYAACWGGGQGLSLHRVVRR